MMDFLGWVDKVIEDVLRTNIQLRVFSPGDMHIAMVSIRVFRIITNITGHLHYHLKSIGSLEIAYFMLRVFSFNSSTLVFNRAL